MSASDDEIGFVEIKEVSLEKVTLVSQVENKFDWIIDSGCLHHITGDMNKFVDFKSWDEGIIRVGNNVAFQVKGIGSTNLDGKTNSEDVYFFDGLKNNILSVGQLVDKDHQLQFIEKTCMIREKHGNVIGIGTRSRGNAF